ncbi:porin b carbohydrate-selective [Lasius niger]|uniref:Porin b carbohydrate-selective n=1 Tax=Lasius niger TaxID=67767 RepID=A0A0J7K1Z2_LASNI|nr:porin b carbohydrate-selective [Lasius niger]
MARSAYHRKAKKCFCCRCREGRLYGLSLLALIASYPLIHTTKAYAVDLPFSQPSEALGPAYALDKEKYKKLHPKPVSEKKRNLEVPLSPLKKKYRKRHSRKHFLTNYPEPTPSNPDPIHQYRQVSEIAGDRLTLQDSGPSVNNSDVATARISMASQNMSLPWESENPDSGCGDILHRGEMLGSLFGVRNVLDHFGIKFGVMDIEEVWGNPTGGGPSQAEGSPVWGGDGRGSSQSASYVGVTMLSLQADLKKTIGPKMGTFNISALQIRGRSLSQDHLGVFNPISGQEADRSFRLFELWYQQPFFHDIFDVRIGQMDLDTEFLISDYGGLYLNSNFGWPMIPSADLYSGGPSWPLASPGVRVRYRPSERFSFLFAASDDNPPGNQNNAFAIQDGGDSADPTNQDVGRSASGTKFNMGTGALLIEELQYSVTFGKHHGGLPGIYKLGGYYDTGKYPSFYRNQQGEPLGNVHDRGDPNTPAWLRGNWAVYGIMDQMIWRPKHNPYQSVGIFFRGMGTQGDRNLITFAADAGINFKAPFHNRPNDTLGLGWGIGVASSGARHFDMETDAIKQTTENHMELTYQAMVTPWLNLQPDFQYIFRPSGGVQDYAYDTKRRIGDEAILGLHANIAF